MTSAAESDCVPFAVRIRTVNETRRHFLTLPHTHILAFFGPRKGSCVALALPSCFFVVTFGSSSALYLFFSKEGAQGEYS